MMHVVTAANVSRHDALMEKTWRFRHEQFVDRLGWTGLRKPDAREIDQFDLPNAIHLPLTASGQVVAYSRLLPTTAPHLLSDVYPEIMSGAAWPREDDIYEWTRCAGLTDRIEPYGVQAAHLIYVGVAEFCLAAGIRALLVETHPKLASRLMEIGWRVEPLSVPMIYEGRPFGAILAYPTMETLRVNRELFGIRGTVIDIEPGLPNPLNAQELLESVDALNEVTIAPAEWRRPAVGEPRSH